MIINIFIFLAVFFVLVFFIGKFFEKFKIPWIFSSLLIGVLLALKNPFITITTSSEFEFLSSLGMIFLLFVIGFEINIKKMKKLAGFIVKSTFFIILIEALFGTLLIYFVFEYSLFISFIVGISFATVGEAILIPILDEFKLVNTKLGQMIIGIGTFDDIFEIAVLTVLVVFLGVNSSLVTNNNLIISILALSGCFLLTMVFIHFKKNEERFKFSKIETLFLLSIAILFIFVGLGELSGISAIGALLAGISLRTFLPNNRRKAIESEIKSLCYGFFAPIFFLSVGLALDIRYITSNFWLVLLVFVIAAGSKLIASYVFTSKKIGNKNAVLLGIGLSARFSTSIVIIKILLESNLIKEDLYSVIIASSILFTLLIPILFSKLIVKWKLKK